MSAALTIVSGKGGVGKSLVAAALARQSAAQGVRTLLVDLGDASGSASVLGVVPRYQPASVARDLDVARLSARSALREYVDRKMTFSFAYKRLLENSAVQKFLDALPLFDELMALGKLYDFVTGELSDYQRVVFDAPATGHCKLLLNVPAVAVDTLKAGPIYDNARKIQSLLTDSQRCALTVVTLPEETPAREAEDLAAYASETLAVRCDRLIVNRCIDAQFTAQEREQIERLDAGQARWAAQLNEAVAEEQAVHRQSLEALGLDTTLLPDVATRDTDSVLEMMATRL